MTHRTSTRNRFYLSCYILLFLFLSFYSCRQEGVNKPKHDLSMEMAYPQMSGKDPRILHIIRELRAMDHQTRLAQKFVDVQATPLWDCAILAEKGIDTLLFVPIQSKRTPEEIQTIWTFYIHGDTTFTYSFYHSNEVQDEDQWRFDYFTTFALGKTPKSGARFTTPEGQQIPRYGYYVENCVTNYYYAGPPPVTRWIPRTRCWTAFLQSGADGSNPDDQNTGGGGGTPPTGSRPIPGSGGGGGNGGSPNPAPTPTPEPLKGHFDKIEKLEVFKNTRVDTLYEKLIVSGDVPAFLLRSFKEKPSRLGHLYLKLDPIPSVVDPTTNERSTTYGRTEFLNGSKSELVITLNSLYIDRMTDLQIAIVLLHEIVHARLSILKITIDQRYKTQEERDKALDEAAPGIADYYRRFGPKYSHEMFHHYKDDFILTMQKMFKDPSVTKERCEAIFWSGLSETVAYKELPKYKKEKYKNICAEEEKFLK